MKIKTALGLHLTSQNVIITKTKPSNIYAVMQLIRKK